MERLRPWKEDPLDESVEDIKGYLENKETKAKESAPEGMEFQGWILDGWLVTYPPRSDLALPIYSFKEDFNNQEEGQRD
jgi:hypothetical protein